MSGSTIVMGSRPRPGGAEKPNQQQVNIKFRFDAQQMSANKTSAVGGFAPWNDHGTRVWDILQNQLIFYLSGTPAEYDNGERQVLGTLNGFIPPELQGYQMDDETKRQAAQARLRPVAISLMSFSEDERVQELFTGMTFGMKSIPVDARVASGQLLYAKVPKQSEMVGAYQAGLTSFGHASGKAKPLLVPYEPRYLPLTFQHYVQQGIADPILFERVYAPHTGNTAAAVKALFEHQLSGMILGLYQCLKDDGARELTFPDGLSAIDQCNRLAALLGLVRDDYNTTNLTTDEKEQGKQLRTNILAAINWNRTRGVMYSELPLKEGNFDRFDFYKLRDPDDIPTQMAARAHNDYRRAIQAYHELSMNDMECVIGKVMEGCDQNGMAYVALRI